MHRTGSISGHADHWVPAEWSRAIVTGIHYRMPKTTHSAYCCTKAHRISMCSSEQAADVTDPAARPRSCIAQYQRSRSRGAYTQKLYSIGIHKPSATNYVPVHHVSSL